MSYVTSNELKNNRQVEVGAEEVVTISNEFVIRDPLNLIVDIEVSGVEVTTGITATLQDTADGGVTWHNKKTATVTEDGVVTIKLTQVDLNNDANHLPLRPRARVLISTGDTDAVNVDAVRVTRRI